MNSDVGSPVLTDIKPVMIEAEMKKSYLDYAMSVIVSRALPDVRDGLKPVHRRILYAMKDAGNDYNRPHRKSSRVIGDVMGKYHPHGDTAIYDAMARMAQNFSLRLTLIDGQGNFGSMDGDSPAAPRYTEVRLAKATHDLLADIDKDTVSFQPNYDDTTKEPTVLPARFPNLLINGANGIAVGMATNIPPHNLSEIIDACCVMVDNPGVGLSELLQIVPGPDFPTGGIIMGRYGIAQAYKTGRGSITVRSKTHIEVAKNDRESIIVTEIPYQVNKAKMIEKIADLVKTKVVEGISDLRDESDREGVRVVIELKKDAISEVVLNQLYKYSPLQVGYSFNMLALVHGRPDQLSLQQILQNFLDFREEVIVKRTKYELAKAREKAHTLLGFAVAVANIDEMIAVIKAAPDRPSAKNALMEKGWQSQDILPMIKLIESQYNHPDDLSQNSVDPTDTNQNFNYYLTEIQAQAILDLRLHRLTGLERDKIPNDLNLVVAQIQEFLAILASRERVLQILKNELNNVKNEYGTPRRTLIEDGDSIFDIEDLIQKEDMVITVSMSGYIKRVPLSTYKSQKRGGKGRSAMATKEEDVVNEVIVANTHSQILFFTSVGKVYQMKGYKLPLASPQSKGRALINMLPLANGEKVTTILVMPQNDDGNLINDGGVNNPDKKFFMFATSNGNVRRNRLDDFANIPSNGKRAMKLDESEKLIGVRLCTEDDDVMLFTKNGLCNRFNMDNIRIFAGRDSNRVRGIKLQPSDEVIGMTILSKNQVSMLERDQYIKYASKVRQNSNDDGDVLEEDFHETILDDEENDNEGAVAEIDTNVIVSPERLNFLAAQEQFILTITENGFGKRSSAYQYRTTRRGGVGIDSIIVNARNGGVVASFPVNDDDDIIMVTDGGRLIRCPVKDIRIAGRRTQGVIIFRIADNEKVVSVSWIPYSGVDETVDEDIDELS